MTTDALRTAPALPTPHPRDVRPRRWLLVLLTLAVIVPLSAAWAGVKRAGSTVRVPSRSIETAPSVSRS